MRRRWREGGPWGGGEGPRCDGDAHGSRTLRVDQPCSLLGLISIHKMRDRKVPLGAIVGIGQSCSRHARPVLGAPCPLAPVAALAPARAAQDCARPPATRAPVGDFRGSPQRQSLLWVLECVRDR